MIISSISFDQYEILENIVNLHTGDIELDPTYSRGQFYKSGRIKQPRMKFDLFPNSPDVQKSDAKSLPIGPNSIKSMMFDPPFIAGHTKASPTGRMGIRFHGFRYMKDLWAWYDECLKEFSRVVQPGGHLIVKCQDTVSSGTQFWSHVHLINKAESLGFKLIDLFVLLAKSRVIGHNHQNQKHARKFHSYFLVFKKEKTK